ncbi:hypothetical protein CDAR_554101 [Caerostris darwini]|uniref:Uncharacterized protein n=1 Tax=Caerostris darwini TaxID=1538125 RepID=A0AAV4X7J6_9ARAC|nr:hypothetical protein CDAR_554101 [Caerostris darwini]
MKTQHSNPTTNFLVEDKKTQRQELALIETIQRGSRRAKDELDEIPFTQSHGCQKEVKSNFLNFCKTIFFNSYLKPEFKKHHEYTKKTIAREAGG